MSLERIAPVQEGGGGRLFNLLAMGQGERLQAEVLILVASLRRASPTFPGRVVIARR